MHFCMNHVMAIMLCAGSSEALLSGQKPPFALLVRALDGASGQGRADIPPAASEGFVVSVRGEQRSGAAGQVVD